MATLRNKRKLAAVSRETPESTRSGTAPNILDPELTQDYISQVSEEIEGRVTKKLSKEFSKTESRILGALSKLDEFLLNPQVRTCSVVAPGTSRSNNLENQGTNEDRPSDDPGPEVEFVSPILGAETNPHIIKLCKFFQKLKILSLFARKMKVEKTFLGSKTFLCAFCSKFATFVDETGFSSIKTGFSFKKARFFEKKLFLIEKSYQFSRILRQIISTY